MQAPSGDRTPKSGTRTSGIVTGWIDDRKLSPRGCGKSLSGMYRQAARTLCHHDFPTAFAVTP